MPQNRDGAGGGREQSFKDFDGSGLPRPVRPEQAETLASVNFEIQSSDRFNLAVVSFAQVAAFDGGRHWETQRVRGAHSESRGCPTFFAIFAKEGGDFDPSRSNTNCRSQNPHPVAQIATRMGHPFTTMYRGLAAEIFRVALGEGVPFLRQI